MCVQGVETTTPDNKATVEGLTEGKEYEFRVMAKNKAGLSEPSVPSPVIFTRSMKGAVLIAASFLRRGNQKKSDQFEIKMLLLGKD